MRKRIFIASVYIIIVSVPFWSQAQEYLLLINETDTSKSLSTQLVNSFLLPDSSEVFATLTSIFENYSKKGFLTARIDSLKRTEQEVYVYISPGLNYSWINITHQNIPNADDRKLKLRLHKYTDQPINIGTLNSIKNKIVTYYENSGFPFAQVGFDSIQIIGNQISGQLTLVKGPFVPIDSIHIKGNIKTHTNYIHKRLDIYPGMPYSEKTIRSLDKLINEISFLDDIKPSEIEFFDQSADLFLYLKPKKANRFNGILGILPNNENNGKLLLTGEIDFRLENSLKRGETINLLWKKTESASQNLDFSFEYPFLFNTPIAIQYQLFIDKKDSNYLNVENKLGLQYFLSGNNHLGIFYTSRNSSKLQTAYSTGLADVKINLVGISNHFHHLDNIRNPQKGYSIDAAFAYGKKQFNTNSELNSETEPTQFEGIVSASIFMPILRRFVGMVSSKSLFIKSNSTLYENELNKFGGNSTLRGFDEESLLASSYSILTLELRYLFEEYSNLFAFVDGAYYEKNTDSSTITDTPFGFGVGTSFQTKAGIFSISYALGKQFDNPIELRNAKVHFGLVSYF